VLSAEAFGSVAALCECWGEISENMNSYIDEGLVVNRRFGPYRIYAADEAPELQAILVQTYEPSGPYGAKAVAEIPMDGDAPAIANAVYHATGRRFYQIPLTPERVWRGLRA
jgi:putative selenate reductase molybdopterin-binding subunit